jgi:hypothetical protein
MNFEIFDPQSEVRITCGNLPHWYQPGVTYFITFRTADSIPAGVADLWYRRRNDWLQRHGIDPKHAGWQTALRWLPQPQQFELVATAAARHRALRSLPIVTRNCNCREDEDKKAGSRVKH